MEYRNLGRTGVKVSPLCLGTMMFGRSANEADSIAIIEHALDKGINFVDTANAYSAGASERFVGKALAGGRRASGRARDEGVFSAGPEGPERARLEPPASRSRRATRRSKRLQTDWIDLYQLHRAQSDMPIDETLRASTISIRAGKIRYIGTSMFPSWKMRRSRFGRRRNSA